MRPHNALSAVTVFYIGQIAVNKVHQSFSYPKHVRLQYVNITNILLDVRTNSQEMGAVSKFVDDVVSLTVFPWLHDPL